MEFHGSGKYWFSFVGTGKSWVAMGGNRNSINFSFPTHSKIISLRIVRIHCWKNRSVLEKVTQFRCWYFKLIFSYFWCQKTSIRCVITGYLYHGVHEKTATVRWDSSMGLAAGGIGNNWWDWEGNGNKIWLSLGGGMGMGVNRWEREGEGLKKSFPLISTMTLVYQTCLSWCEYTI